MKFDISIRQWVLCLSFVYRIIPYCERRQFSLWQILFVRRFGGIPMFSESSAYRFFDFFVSFVKCAVAFFRRRFFQKQRHSRVDDCFFLARIKLQMHVYRHSISLCYSRSLTTTTSPIIAANMASIAIKSVGQPGNTNPCEPLLPFDSAALGGANGLSPATPFMPSAVLV